MSITLALGSPVQLFNPDDVERAMAKADGQHNEGQRRVYSKMLEAGPERFISSPSNTEALAPVRQQCPHFSGVLEDLADYIELSLQGTGGLNVNPILLAGDPGVGKTHFAKTVAAALNLPYQFISMGTMTAGWVLAGSAPTWSGARHGKVTEALIDETFANPVCLVDELDKTGGDSRYDPFGALLQLLEPDTARHFKDEFLDVPMDASRVLWIATANSLEKIPDPILTRVSVYEVPAPTSEQSRVIAQNIYQELLRSRGVSFEPVLNEDALDVLSRVPPREMRKKILPGMARAASARRSAIQADDITSSHLKTNRPMGFLAG